MQEFVLRSALRPNQISFPHSLDQKLTGSARPPRLALLRYVGTPRRRLGSVNEKHSRSEAGSSLQAKGGRSWKRFDTPGICRAKRPDSDGDPQRVHYGGRMNQIIRELKRQAAGQRLGPEQLKSLIRAGYVYRNGAYPFT